MFLNLLPLAPGAPWSCGGWTHPRGIVPRTRAAAPGPARGARADDDDGAKALDIHEL